MLPGDFNLQRTLFDSQRLSQQSLQVLAEETGGFAAINRNDFAVAFEGMLALFGVLPSGKVDPGHEEATDEPGPRRVPSRVSSAPIRETTGPSRSPRPDGQSASPRPGSRCRPG